MSGRGRAAVVLWGLLLGASGLLLATRGAVTTDLAVLLPPGSTEAQQLMTAQVQGGPASRMVLIGVEGRSPDRLAVASRQLAAWMRASQDFVYVANGDQRWATEEGDLLFEHRYLLSPAIDASRFEVEQLRRALQHRLRDLASPLGAMVQDRLTRDPTGEFAEVLRTWRHEAPLRRHHGVWLSPDGGRALLLAQTRPPAFALNEQARLLSGVQQAFSRITEGLGTFDSMGLVLSGPAVFSVDARRTIKEESWKLSAVAGCLVIAFLYAAYPSIVLVALTLVPLASGMLVGVAAVCLVFGSIHGITLAFGMTLIGVAIDYPIHLFSQVGGEGSAKRAAELIWPTLRLGALTTITAFSAMLFSDFPGLSQLGCFAVVGLVVAGLVTRWVLPVLVPSSFTPTLPSFALRPVLAVARTGRWAPVIAALAVGGYLAWSDGPRWEGDLANLSPISSQSRALDHELRAALVAPEVRDLVVFTGPTEQDVLERSEDVRSVLERLVRQDVLVGYHMAAQVMPSARTQRLRQDALPDRSGLKRALRRALATLPFEEDAFAPFVQAVAEAKRQAPLTSAQLGDTALGLRVRSTLFERDGQWAALVLLQGVSDRQKLVEAVQGDAGVDATYLDLKHESNRLLDRYRDEAVPLLGWGALAIMVVLAVGLRAPKTVSLVLLPIGCSLLITLGILHGIGERLSLFHVTSFLLVLGIGLDYALFLHRPGISAAELERTVLSVLVCAGTTILVFTVLAWSDLPILRAIGITVAFGSLCCLLCTAAFSREPLSEGPSR